MQGRYLVLLAALAVTVTVVYASSPANPNDPLIQSLARWAVAQICRTNYLTEVRRAESDVTLNGIVYTIRLDMVSNGIPYRCKVEVLYREYDWSNQQTLIEYRCQNTYFL